MWCLNNSKDMLTIVVSSIAKLRPFTNFKQSRQRNKVYDRVRILNFHFFLDAETLNDKTEVINQKIQKLCYKY